MRWDIQSLKMVASKTDSTSGTHGGITVTALTAEEVEEFRARPSWFASDLKDICSIQNRYGFLVDLFICAEKFDTWRYAGTCPVGVDSMRAVEYDCVDLISYLSW